MKNKKIVPAISALFIMSILAVSIASACSCIYLPDAQAKYDNAAFVFSGKTVDVVRMESYPVQQKVTFQVNKYWKLNSKLLDNNGNVIINAHEDDGANCGYTFQEDQEYLIYAYLDQETNKLTTNSCMGDLLIEEADSEIQDLNDIVEPTEVEINNNIDDPQRQNPISRFFNWLKNLFS